MPVDRPTFSESWYRVADLCPRVRSTVQVHRQHFRGRMWHVLQDPSSNQFFRLNEPAYRFVGMLNGKRTIADIWRVCNEQLGDSAPTQGEVIQLLGQLYTSNLLQADLPPDAEGLFRRYQKRRGREVRGYLMNLLFARIPLLDPDRFLDLWVSVLGRLFSWFGFAMWLILISAGVYLIVPRFGVFLDRTQTILDPSKLPLLYVGFILAKLFHEFGHAFACKTFGRRAGSGGEVHVMGIMFLVFMPMPYVDASSAWAFRRKWDRVIVGAGGMLVEFAVAAIAVIVWAGTEGAVGGAARTVNALAHNVIFIASVSTLLFNINPLLRFDGYYILSDLTEIPNLAARSRRYISYLVKRYAWSVRRAQSPAHTAGERRWFAFYGIASTVFRVYICIRILLFLGDRLPRELFIVAMAFAALSAVAWAAVPVGKFIHYLATSGELARVRGRAVGSTLATVAAVVLAVGILRVPDRFYLEGVVEPVQLAIVHTKADGFLENYLPTGRTVTPEAAVLINDAGGDQKEKLWARANPALAAKRQQVLTEQRILRAQRSWALDERRDAEAQGLLEQIEAKSEQIRRIEQELAALSLQAPIEGTWIAWDIEKRVGEYIPRGEPVGMIASLDDVIIRATAEQDTAGILIEAARNSGDLPAEIRIRGRPDMKLSAMVSRDDISSAGQEQLPSAALGYAAGGPVQTDLTDRSGTKAARRFFEVRIRPPRDSRIPLRSGQRVIVRIQTPAKPLIFQWWRTLLQIIQRRYGA